MSTQNLQGRRKKGKRGEPALLTESSDLKRAGVFRINKIPNVDNSKSPYRSGLYPLHFQIGKSRGLERTHDHTGHQRQGKYRAIFISVPPKV